MNKIEALEKTIYNLENDVYKYRWMDCDNCNCGVVAKTIMNGKPASEGGLWFLDQSGCGFAGVYNDGVSHCEKTGTPLPEVFKALRESGFSFEDLAKLEGCSHEKEGVITYMKRWVARLKEEEAAKVVATPIPEVKQRITYVTIDNPIKQQAREGLLMADLVS
jgi:hypothetical protein